ncbi:glycosyltransferase family 2 protein [Candidatus Methylomirabilis sp.]|uniref:glycosyltransferase family 2 protein n=1 Tax=Candidatus Methylomirabilis sp. TaxID=2032687 RepID=UPI002A5D4C9D|nr:glycosyltransferase family 2 protein [Candidatus Methylomirabilis sp.]
MADLSVIVITYNEEKNIQTCLESLTWAKEIIVVDSGSSDRTLEICRGYTDKIFIHPWIGFIEQKDFAVSLATHDWILNIDADERVSEELRQAIERELAAPRYDGYRIARRNYFLGWWMRHGGWYPDRVLRLFDRRKGRFGGLNPHAYFVIAEGSVGCIDRDLVHLTYQEFSQYLRKQDWYTGISAEQQVTRGRQSGSVTGSELLLRALVKFVQLYLFKRGFLDGMHGLIAAVGASYFNFIKYAKIWELGLRTESGQGTESRQERLLDRHSAPAVTPPPGQDERTVGVSALVITLNEEENIQQCLESVSWADEIVVVDAVSEDRTVEMSRRFTDKVYLNPWPGFPAQRNFGLERTGGQWVLILDADERVTPAVRDEILACITRADREGVVAYQVPRKNFFFGRWLRWGGAFPDLQWRLFKRGFIRYDETTLDTPIVGGASGTLQNPIDHFTGRSIHQRLRKIDAETQIKAREIMARCARIGWSDVTFRPMIACLKVYLLKQGFRDGLHGLVFAVLCSFHTFTRYVKAWELGRRLRCSG